MIKTLDKAKTSLYNNNEQKFEGVKIMISNLHIKNIGIIEDISINLNQGFNVLTGETGAGKTLIIDSLNIIAGGRFSKEMMRRGQEHSFVEVCFYLPQNPNAIEGNIIVSREIYASGRNLCKINGRLVTVNELKEFMQNIIDIHGQQDNQILLQPNSHIQYLDDFAKEEIAKIKEEYLQLYKEYNHIKIQLKNNYGDEKEKQRKLDLLQYQKNEIEEAELKKGEYEQLEETREKIVNAEKIVQNLNEVENQISNQAIDSINMAVRAFEKIENLDNQYTEKLTILKSIYYDLQELSRDITQLKEENDFNEEQRQQTEQRLDLIYSLKRKYGNNIEEILKYKEEITQEIEKIENLEKFIQDLKKQEEKIKVKMLNLCEKMHEIRKKYANQLAQEIDQQLQELEMKNAKFSMDIKMPTNQDFGENGLSHVEFLITTNKGEEAKPLIKIASGGEMSRIMLAIKNVLAKTDRIPVLVFDEIDTGISGMAANCVAEKMKQIAKHHQVLCVTHLASIAARGDYNYYISKEVMGEHTNTKVKQLTEEEVVQEIARIASGNITKLSLEHAKELRKQVVA